jgi:hypothetical protein
LAGIALELGALAFAAYVLMGDEVQTVPRPVAPRVDVPEEPPAVQAEPATAAEQAEAVLSGPMDFITEPADAGARYYRATADGAELVAGFYSDGRVRLTDEENRRFAGLLQGTQADLLEIGTNRWSQLLVHTTPAGTMELELRGGPYDARVLSCEAFSQARMTQ